MTLYILVLLAVLAVFYVGALIADHHGEIDLVDRLPEPIVVPEED